MQSKTNRSKLMVLVSALLLSIASVGIWFARSATSQEASLSPKAKPAEIRIINNVPKLEVVRTREDEGKFVVTIKNTLDKTINGFYTTTGEISYQTELIYSDRLDAVSPSMEYDVPADLDDNLRKHGLTIRAVLFENGDGAGEDRFIREMQEKRAGEKAALARGQVLLNQFLTGGRVRSTDLKQMKDMYSSSPDNRLETESTSTKFGMHAGKERFTNYIDVLRLKAEKDTTFDLEGELRNLNAKLQRFTSKL